MLLEPRDLGSFSLLRRAIKEMRRAYDDPTPLRSKIGDQPGALVVLQLWDAQLVSNYTRVLERARAELDARRYSVAA